MKYLVQSAAELPNIVGTKSIIADFETTSAKPNVMSTNPWHDCYALGLAIKPKGSKDSWYIPVGHHNQKWNIDFNVFCRWWFDVLSNSEEWINHNVKYDAHVSANSAGALIGFDYRLKCTLTQAKLIDSDRGFKGGYGIDALAKDWLKKDITHHKKVFAPYLHNNKDYGAIPADLMCDYACDDVETTDQLDDYIEANLHEECRRVSNNEIGLTHVLFDMERNGLRVDPTLLKQQELFNLQKMMVLDEKMEAITGRTFRPDSNDDCYDVLCNQYGAPVLGWTETGNPSFDKFALADYLTCIDVPKELIECMIEYREVNTFNNFFVVPYQDLHVDGYLHSDYNQAVRTGRMSCKNPNSQQLNKSAKALILPDEGESFLSVDDSQIEYRTIAHYVNNEAIVKAYNEDPHADYHQLVADMIGITRKPAKTMNFMIAFGGGKAKVEAALASNVDLVGQLEERAKIIAERDNGNASAIFKKLRQAKAESTYNDYHKMIPELKSVAKRAERVCKQRGYIRNLLGRHRQLPPDIAYRAFNNLNQSSAADLMKERLVYMRELLKGTPIKYRAQVHDEILLSGPSEAIEDDRTLRAVLSHMENPNVPELRVPVRCSYGYSRENWKEAASGEHSLIDYEPSNFDHLR